MARLMKCPRCTTVMDVSAYPPEKLVVCHGCRAQVRVPHPPLELMLAEPAPRTSRAAAPRGGGRTPLFRKMSAARGPGGGRATFEAPEGPRAAGPLAVGLGVLIAAGVLAAVALARSSPPPDVARRRPEASRARPPVPVAPETVRPAVAAAEIGPGGWDRTMEDLRAGGGFDDPGCPAGAAFERVRNLGREAYRPLIGYLGHDDIGLARAAVAVLNALTGRAGRLPNQASREAVRQDWEAWLSGVP